MAKGMGGDAGYQGKDFYGAVLPMPGSDPMYEIFSILVGLFPGIEKIG